MEIVVVENTTAFELKTLILQKVWQKKEVFSVSESFSERDVGLYTGLYIAEYNE